MGKGGLSAVGAIGAALCGGSVKIMSASLVAGIIGCGLGAILAVWAAYRLGLGYSPNISLTQARERLQTRLGIKDEAAAIKLLHQWALADDLAVWGRRDGGPFFRIPAELWEQLYMDEVPEGLFEFSGCRARALYTHAENYADLSFNAEQVWLAGLRQRIG